LRLIPAPSPTSPAIDASNLRISGNRTGARRPLFVRRFEIDRPEKPLAASIS
jgi:hypothetical protein